MSLAIDTALAVSTNVLKIEGLKVAYRVKGTDREVLHSLDLTIGRGESVGLVGESGCGKSTAALAVLRYLPPNGRITSGSISILGQDLYSLSPTDLRHLRLNSIAMVYQDPGKALNPTLSIGRQIGEVFELKGKSRTAALAAALDALKVVRIRNPDDVLNRYSHELSGGMQQRVCIAMALAANPQLLILDEPTTGLDATVEAEILELIAQLRADLGMSILFISHNLAVVSQMCDRVGILYAGMLAEEGPAQEVFRDPRHPYTAALLNCLPRRGQRKDQGRLRTLPGFLPSPGDTIKGCAFAERCSLADGTCRTLSPPLTEVKTSVVVYPADKEEAGGRRARCFHSDRVDARGEAPDSGAVNLATDVSADVLLDVRDVSKSYVTAQGVIKVLHDLSLEVKVGETLGIVGESGSGKSTLAKLLLGLQPHDTGGRISLAGETLAGRLRKRTSGQIKGLQIVFQNPDSALNRSHSVERILGRALRKLSALSGPAVNTRLEELMESVRLPTRYQQSLPRQLSGGLKQRVAIARAFAGEPRLVLCDEPTSALDVSVQAAILNLLTDLQARSRVAYVFISHDLGVVRFLSDRILVLYHGRIMELGPAEQVFAGPHHPYTEALLSAVPDLDGTPSRRILVKDAPVGVGSTGKGCVFQMRCHRKIGTICENQDPPLKSLSVDHHVKCHLSSDALGRSHQGN
jgi:peptide/nickel transport system ATP-binding protein